MVSTFVPRFTFIIPFRYSPDRILNLKRVIDWLSGFQAIEILIVEQDKHSKLDYMSLKANHIFIQSDLPFNKSWAYNVGFKRANSPIIIFGEADFIMNPMEMIESLKLIESYDCIIPTDKVSNLSQRESMMDTQSIFNLKNGVSKSTLLDGISIFKKEAIERIAGWNEDMIGLGFENAFEELKMKQLLRYHQMNYLGYHLHHNKTQPIQQLQQRNNQIFDTYNKDPKLIQQHIQQVGPKIGMKNRFTGIS
jgi:hypothetical protein